MLIPMPNGAAIDYLSSRHLGALIESSDFSLRTVGSAPEVVFVSGPRGRAAKATPP
jgi:hypothetical protein